MSTINVFPILLKLCTVKGNQNISKQPKNSKNKESVPFISFPEGLEDTYSFSKVYFLFQCRISNYHEILCAVFYTLGKVREIEIIHRLFLVIAMYCQASSSQVNKSLNLQRCQLAENKVQVHAVGSNSPETTQIYIRETKGTYSSLIYIYYLNFLRKSHALNGRNDSTPRILTLPSKLQRSLTFSLGFT